MYRTVLHRLVQGSLLCSVLLGLGVAVLAQGPGGQGQGRNAAGPGGGRGGRGVSLASLPVNALDAIVKLTPDQKKKITEIRENHAKEMAALRPQQGQGFDPGAMQKIRELNTRTSGQIEAVLTPAQKTKMQEARQELRLYRMAGIPLGLYGQIKLTEDQKARLQELMPSRNGRGAGPGAPGAPGQRGGFQQIREKVDAILTPAQKTQIANYLKAHPEEQRSRRGGFGGGRP